MPSHPVAVLTFALIAAVCALPVDEISVRNGIDSATSGVDGQTTRGSVYAGTSSCIISLGECALSEALGTSLLRMGSEHVGNGDNALSGASNGKALLSLIGGTNSTSKVPVSSGSSGDGGETTRGSLADNHPAPVELGSDNAEQGRNPSGGNNLGLVN